MLALTLLLQAVAGPADPAAVRARPAAPRCGDGAGGDVVVCGRRGESPYRLKPLPPRPGDPPLPPMTVHVPGGTLNASAAQSELPGGSGAGGKVTLRVPF